MPPIAVSQDELKKFGDLWKENNQSLPKKRPLLSDVFDSTVANSLAAMLGGIPHVETTKKDLIPPQADCVERGLVRVIGGVRPQNFDVGYRPDGIRFAFDSKTLNDTASVKKNYQNMINDLSTEATTVHSRFPYALVAFMVIIPEPCLLKAQRAALIETLDRLGRRRSIVDPPYLAEVATLVLWDPDTGEIDPQVPAASHIRIEQFSELVSRVYTERYKGLPPHADIGKEAEEAMEEKDDLTS